MRRRWQLVFANGAARRRRAVRLLTAATTTNGDTSSSSRPTAHPPAPSTSGGTLRPPSGEHDGTYSIVVKDNHYNPDYSNPQNGDAGPFFVTQLSAAMTIEWQFQNTNSQYCYYQVDSGGRLPAPVTTTTPPPGATPTCEHTSMAGFEWCVNAPAVDANGTVFVNGEDGVLYAIGQGGIDRGHLFLRQAIGSSYTPVAIDSQGRLYAQNAGQLLVVGH